MKNQNLHNKLQFSAICQTQHNCLECAIFVYLLVAPIYGHTNYDKRNENMIYNIAADNNKYSETRILTNKRYAIF